MVTIRTGPTRPCNENTFRRCPLQVKTGCCLLNTVIHRSYSESRVVHSKCPRSSLFTTISEDLRLLCFGAYNQLANVSTPTARSAHRNSSGYTAGIATRGMVSFARMISVALHYANTLNSDYIRKFSNVNKISFRH